MERDFFLEIGTEEIPASFLPQALEDFQRMAHEFFGQNRLTFGTVKAMGTPRRLALLVSNLADVQGDLIEEVTGPPRTVAFDDEGNPTKALEKFCSRYGVSPEDTSFVRKEKGEYVCLKRIEKGAKTEDLLPPLLPDWILSLPFPKSMRWGMLDIRFVRPIQWVVAIHGDKTLVFQVGDVTSSNATFGHRFMGKSGSVTVEDTEAYLEALPANGVILDPEDRRSRILHESQALAEEVGGYVAEDEEFVQTLVFLTEYPVALRGAFEQRFLSLPQEVLVATMKGHQKYLPIRQKGGGEGLLPYFVAVANIKVPDQGRVRKGMERVLKARLEDARFFFEADTKVPLEENLDGLKQIIFHKKLGTSHEKVQRVQRLVRVLGEEVCPERLDVLERASLLCKADLVTQMVGEFPELQGIMGGIYAAHSGESTDVAQAIREHYLPVSAEDHLPTSLSGAVLSVADKMDTVVGFFGVGARVSGTQDPFGLRRRTLGVIRILLEKGLEVSLPWFVQKSMEILDQRIRRNRDEVFDDVLEFFRQRYRPMLLAKGFPHDTIDAVFSWKFENIPDLYERIQVLHRMRVLDPDFEKLIIGCKRAMNIVQQAERELGFSGDTSSLRPSALVEDAEKNLYQAADHLRDKIVEEMKNKQYEAVLRDLVDLKNPIDRLFDEVMVLVDDKALRENRIGLLVEVTRLFQGFADFSRIVF